MRVELGELRLARFRSFVQPTRIALNGGAGLTLISGDNQVEPRLGGNGAGKSTIWDALVFCLYGSSVKGARAADLVSRGQEDTEVSVALEVDGMAHVVRRTAPPNRLSLDGEPVEQAAIDRLIGLTRARFLHSVVFGQAVPLFLDLSVPDRGDVLDGVLQLEVWIRAAELATRKYRDKTAEVSELRRQIAHKEGVLTGLGDPERLSAAIADWEAGHRSHLDGKLAELEALAAEVDNLGAGEILQLHEEAELQAAYEDFRARHDAARERLTRAALERSQILETARFLAREAHCPTCDQPITREHAEGHAERTRGRLNALAREHENAELDVNTLHGDMLAAEATWRAVIQENHRLRAEHTANKRALEERWRRLEALEREIERIGNEANPHAAEQQRIAWERTRLLGELAVLQRQEQQADSEARALEFWRQGFRRCRLFCLDRVLGELTAEAGNALLSLGLVGWEVRFTTASETRSGTVRLGVQADLKSPAAAGRFELCSGGEGQRARLAVSLGLAQLIHRWAGVQVGFEVWDEPTAWLSDEGIADLLECLAQRAETTEKQVYVLDHRALSHGGFRRVLTVTKDFAGSRVDNGA